MLSRYRKFLGNQKPHIYKTHGKYWVCRTINCTYTATSPIYAYRGWARRAKWIKQGKPFKRYY